MVYAGGTIADALCHINKWGRCSLPIHTLEIGLNVSLNSLYVLKLMVYAEGTIADALCHINKWGRYSLPIHTLEIGLNVSLNRLYVL